MNTYQLDKAKSYSLAYTRQFISHRIKVMRSRILAGDVPGLLAGDVAELEVWVMAYVLKP